MKVSPGHLLSQGPVLRTLLRTVIDSALVSLRGRKSSRLYPRHHIFEETVPPRSPKLIRDYVSHVGGDPSWYRHQLPSHMFPQWAFPIMAGTLRNLNYNLMQVLNAGCRIEIAHPIPVDKPLLLKAKVKDVNEKGRKALLTQQLVTGTSEIPDAIVAYVTVFVPLGKRHQGSDKQKEKKNDRPRVPLLGREIARLRLKPDCGIEYGFLTGDINPIHWLAPYARLSGFKNPILHGFSTLARTVESLNHAVWSGNPNKLRTIDVRFVRPLVLPCDVGVYIDGAGGISLGEVPGATAYLHGNYSSK